MVEYTFQKILAVLLAGVVAFFAWRFFQSLKFERGVARRVSGMIDSDTRSALDKTGESMADRLGLSLVYWNRQLHLAQLSGKYKGWSAGGLVVRALLAAGAAFVYALIARAGLYSWLVIPLAAAYFFMRVKGAADDTRKNIQRLLPEIATVVAAEMGAGASPDAALGRASELPGALGLLLKNAVSRSVQSNRPAFSRGTVQGVVVETLSEIGIPSLTRFAMQLDRVASKGVEGPRIMGEVARGFARDYKAEVTRAAAALDNQLLGPMTIFFFGPFMLAILLPLFLSLFNVL